MKQKVIVAKLAAALLAVILLIAGLAGCAGEPAAQAIILKNAPTVTSKYGEDLAIDDDGLLRVKYEDDSVADVKITVSMINQSNFNKNTTEEQTLNIEYGGKSVKFTFSLVREAASISIKTEPTVSSYLARPFEIKGDGVLSVAYKDGADEDVTITKEMLDLSGFDINSAAEQTVTVKFGGQTASFKVTLAEDTLDDSGEEHTYRFETEDADYGGGTVDVEDCGSYKKEDGTVDQCVKNLFLGEGGFIEFTIVSNKKTHATLSLSIGAQFGGFPEFDKYAAIYVNDEKVSTGIVYDKTKETWGEEPWWVFQTYTMNEQITLYTGENTIRIATYGYAGITPEAGDTSAEAGGRNITWIELATTGTLTME